MGNKPTLDVYRHRSSALLAIATKITNNNKCSRLTDYQKIECDFVSVKKEEKGYTAFNFSTSKFSDNIRESSFRFVRLTEDTLSDYGNDEFVDFTIPILFT